MTTFLQIRSDRRLFKSRSRFSRTFNLQRSTKYAWAIRWFIKSWLAPVMASGGFVLMLAYALAQWCVQP